MTESNEKLYSRYLVEGNPDDLAVLLERHGRALTLFLFGYVHNLEDAEELMLDSFATVASGTSPFLGRSSFRTWLFSVGKKLALAHMRRQKARPDTLDETALDQIMPDLALLQAERDRQLYQGLAQIKAEYRQVLYLIYFEGMTHEEAGRVMGKSKRQIYNLTERGRKALKEALERMGYDHADY